MSSKRKALNMYGTDVDRLFEIVLPILETADFMNGATIKRRYSPAKGNPRETVVAVEIKK